MIDSAVSVGKYDLFKRNVIFVGWRSKQIYVLLTLLYYTKNMCRMMHLPQQSWEWCILQNCVVENGTIFKYFKSTIYWIKRYNLMTM